MVAVDAKHHLCHQTAPDQTAPDQTAPDQTAPDQTAQETPDGVKKRLCRRKAMVKASTYS